MHVIGTAGHIDHGKTTLVRALTGIDTDRLKEEKERGMTIDLGFAFLALPSGREVGIVDVPGHHRFIKNMLAGVGGVDVALFVVAATEGWMPQSEEHLEILDLLGIGRAVLVLTKIDLVDEEWLELVEEEVRDSVAGTVLEGAPIVRVSSVTGEGIDRLMAALEAALDEAAPPVDLGRPRLWIDRVFSVKGAGTVVTGTLHGGSLRVDDELEAIPGEKPARVRGIQSHNRQMEAVGPGKRVALNLAGIDFTELDRGDALVRPGQLAPSTVFNVHLRSVKSLARPIPKLSQLKLYVGTAERMARVKLLDKDELGPGESCLAQVEVDRACAVAWQDRFVVRNPGEQETVGGGRVLMAPARRVRGLDHRYRPPEFSEAHRALHGDRIPERLDLDLLRSRLDASVEELVGIVLREEGWVELKELPRHVPASARELEEALERAAAAEEAVRLPSYAVSREAWQALCDRIDAALGEYHREYPLRAGVPRETLRSLLGVSWRLFDEALAAMEREGRIASEGARVRQASHRVAFTPRQQQEVDRILAALNGEPFSPPSLDELIEGVEDGEELVGALVERGEIVRVSKGVAFSREAFQRVQNLVVSHIEAKGSIDVAALRDLLDTSRKYAVPILEYLDQIEVTRRVGDVRVLGARAKPA